MPAKFVKTPKQEKWWDEAKDIAEKSKGKSQSGFSDQDWGLVNMLYHRKKKKHSSVVDIVAYRYFYAFQTDTYFPADDEADADTRADMKQIASLVGTAVYKVLLDNDIQMDKDPQTAGLKLLDREKKQMDVAFEFEAEVQDNHLKRTTGYDTVEKRADDLQTKIEDQLHKMLRSKGLTREPKATVKYRRLGPDNIDTENVELILNVRMHFVK